MDQIRLSMRWIGANRVPSEDWQISEQSYLVHIFMLLAIGMAAVLIRRVHMTRDADQTPEPLPYWTIPLCAFLLLGGMILWSILQPEFAANQSGSTPSTYPDIFR